MPSPRLPLSGSAAFTGWRALSPFDVDPLACHHAALSTPSTSGLCSTEESVAATQPFGSAPLDAPMGFGSTRFPMLPRVSRRPDLSVLDVSPRGSNPLQRPRPDSRGRQGVSALSGSCGGAHRRPEGRRLAGDGRFPTRRLVRAVLLALPRREERARRVRLRCVPERSISAAFHIGPRRYSGMPVDPPRGENPPRRFRTPEGARHPTKSRRLPGGSRRDPARAPKNAASGSSSAFPSFRGCPRT
jgi:hypothetical protein